MGNRRSEGTSSPARSRGDQPSSPPPTSRRAEIDRFLDQVKTLGPAVKAGSRGRLIFGLDATMSRQPTWDQACKLQAEMFREQRLSAVSTFSSSTIVAWRNAALRPGLLIRIGLAG